MANQIGKALQKAKYRDRVMAKHGTKLPPGRLRVGSAMQGKVARLNGGQDNSQPWNRVVRHNVEDPNLTVGIMCDISGSMGSTMEPMAVATWVMSEAVRRIQGKIASVYYGNDVFPVLKPGQHLSKVTTYSAKDGSEEFDKGFRALDGALTLLKGNGARLLVICSDGNYRSDQLPKAIAWLNRCRQTGVAVVWLGLSSGHAEDICAETGAHFVPVGSDVTAAARAIGQACTNALTGASR